ncbi:MAG: hypothetical protein JWM19_5824 [Actinomycetia bacterium]|nr:hypothetical protein [Actinomycetes bacterium]
MSRRRGVVKVRLQGDTVGADVIARILADHPAVEVLTGPDRYDGDRQYILVKVASPAEVLARIGAAEGEPPVRDVTQCLASQCPPPKLAECQWPRCAPPPALLRAVCGTHQAVEPYGPCITCGRSYRAHVNAGALWTDDDNDGGTP